MGLFSKKHKRADTIVVPAVGQGPSPIAVPSGDSIEGRTFEIGSEMLRRARGHKTGILSARFYSDALMEWSMKDHEFKVQMFRFVDAFPMLRTPEAVFEHLSDYLSQPGVTVPPVIAAALKAGAIAKGMAAKTISGQITGMAGKFIAGTDAASALPGLKEMWDGGIAFSVDLLGETCLSDEEADGYAKKYLDLINNLPKSVASWKSQPTLENDHLGPIPRTNVSVKISALSARCDPIDTEGSINDLMKRMLPILETARDRGVFVNFDMEHFGLKDFTLELFQRCVEKIDFQAGLAMQAYLRSGPADAVKMCEWAARRGKLITVRLVKGAYWDAETIKSEMHGWPSPVWPRKWMTDRCFEQMAAIFLDACPTAPAARGRGDIATGGPRPSGVKLALGSHNVRSIAAVVAGLERRNLPLNAIELQMLHGMADQLKFAAAEMGLRIREYVPVGEMIPGMAYLVRRLLENTSNESWLKAGFMDNADAGTLLKVPGAGVPDAPLPPEQADRHMLTPAVEGVGDGKPFYTEPMRDFADGAQRAAFAAAVQRATVPKVANDRTPEQAGRLVASAEMAFQTWRDANPRLRSGVLTRAADLMRDQRDGLAGVMIKEAGKTWREADADVCEAIDFCDYYARLAVPMFERERMGKFIGELDEQWYQARGVAVVIAPWNFPLAILCGMTAAALVTGNTVVMKPAEQTPGIASVLNDIFQQALKEHDAPPGVLQFCPSPGETTGAALVRDARIALIAFTGSKAVGLNILEAAGRTPEAQPFVKRVICEMGGKNALIIDQSADLDEAVMAARQSAFGFQGQKCSACSRLIVVDPDGPRAAAISAFTRRFVEATKALVLGDPAKPGTDIGPVIDIEAKNTIAGFIEKGRRECTLELAMPVPAGLEAALGRSFVGPHIFSGVKSEHVIAREEIFGPVVAIMHASSFEEALRIANGSVYKLTGGVFTRKPAHIEKAKREFRVGNLYINRGITGALVGRQPFGGFGMSGVGSKAGGKDYLYQFVEPRASCENTLRRGFAPEL